MILVKITNFNNVYSCDSCSALLEKYGIRRIYNYSIHTNPKNDEMDHPVARLNS
jgi:hypothetical protein